MKTNEYFYCNKYELFDFMVLLMLGILIGSGLTTVKYKHFFDCFSKVSLGDRVI
jgi:hypothetical protein